MLYKKLFILAASARFDVFFLYLLLSSFSHYVLLEPACLCTRLINLTIQSSLSLAAVASCATQFLKYENWGIFSFDLKARRIIESE